MGMLSKAIKDKPVRRLLHTLAEQYGDAPALQIEGEDRLICLTFRELRKRSFETCAFLIKQGIKKGDRVAILSENRPEWSMAFFGIIGAVGIMVPLDTKLREEEIFFILKDSGARFVFTSETFLPVLTKIKKQLPSLEIIVSFPDFLYKIMKIPIK